MKRITPTTLVLLLAVLTLVAVQIVRSRPAPTPEAFAGEVRLEQAITQAGEQGRVVFAVASASWCGPCQSYKRNGLADPKVTAWLEANAVPVYIDIEKNPEEAELLGVRSIPATFVIRDGKVLASRTSAVDGATLLEWLGSVESTRVTEAQ